MIASIKKVSEKKFKMIVDSLKQNGPRSKQFQLEEKSFAFISGGHFMRPITPNIGCGTVGSKIS